MDRISARRVTFASEAPGEVWGGKAGEWPLLLPKLNADGTIPATDCHFFPLSTRALTAANASFAAAE
jgi:hypothetical protein